MGESTGEWDRILSERLPQPVEGIDVEGMRYLVGGNPREVMACYSASNIGIGEYIEGLHEPGVIIYGRIGSVRWRDVAREDVLAAAGFTMA